MWMLSFSLLFYLADKGEMCSKNKNTVQTFLRNYIEGIETLRLVLNALGTDEDGIAVLELSEIPVEEEEKAFYYHFMTVVANRLEDEQIPSTLVNLNMLNMETLIGAYQIVPESGTVVHKYVLRLTEDQEEKAVDELHSCLVDVAAIVNNDYERVLSSIE